MFKTTRVVQFGECDPAGVVYYPVFFRWFHECMESWFHEGLGVPYVNVLTEVGFPARHITTNFHAPLRMGEQIQLCLCVDELRKRSLSFRITVQSVENQLACSAMVVCVCIPVTSDGFDFVPVEIPSFLRDEMQTFLCAD